MILDSRVIWVYRVASHFQHVHAMHAHRKNLIPEAWSALDRLIFNSIAAFNPGCARDRP